VAKQGKSACGRILGANSAAEECASPDSRVFVASVGEKRRCAHARVELTVGDCLERRQTNSRIECASRKFQQCVLAPRRVASGISSSRRRGNCLARRGGDNPHQKEWNKNQRDS